MSATILPFPGAREDVGRCPDCSGIVPTGFTFVVGSDRSDGTAGVEVEEVSYDCPHCGAGITVELTPLAEEANPS